MSWFLKHKFVTLLIVAAGFYWFRNPPDRFGMIYNGFVVYKRIPVVFFDCYIDPDGKLHLVGDLSEPSNLNQWLENNLSSYRMATSGMLPLIVGTGFGDTVALAFSREFVRKCRSMRFEPRFFSTREAIERYHLLRDEEKSAALLLKVR